MSDTVRQLATVLDTADMREVRARRAAEIVRAARNYRWVGIYDVDDDRLELLGHTGVQAPVFVEVSADQGPSGEAVRTRATVIRNNVVTVPILGAESGIAIGTLDVERDPSGAFSVEDREFVERCATALMPLFE